MRPLLLSLGASILILGAVWAQGTGDSTSMPPLPVGQTSKEFEYPIYQEGKLKATLYAAEATGITLNRAETTSLKIQTYDNGAVTTTVTSPKADLYVAEQKMRTKNTVHIVRADMDATSQDCDFDLKTKQYVLRTNVKVILKHFDISSNPAPAAAHAAASASPMPAPIPAISNTNSTPTSPASSDSK